MLIAHYSHRLTADHDITLIRARAAERGPRWDTMPDLHFKGFLLREKGRCGAIANSYSSLYLWRRDEALRDFLVNGRYTFVTDLFGRAEIRTSLAIDSRRGRASLARFAYTEELDIPLDADLTTAIAEEVERNRALARTAGAVAATVGVDTWRWRFTRILLSEYGPDEQGRERLAGTAHEILYLARPLLDDLPWAD